MSKIKVTTQDLWENARELASIAGEVSDISRKNTNALNKMYESTSFLWSWSQISGNNQIIDKFTNLMLILSRGASKAMDCAYAYEEADSNLMNEYANWFNDVEVTPYSYDETTNNQPIPLNDYLSKVSDAEYAKLNDIWTDVCNEDDPIQAFFDRLKSDLPENDPLRKLTPNQIDVVKTASGLAAITIKDNQGNALVIFAGTRDLPDVITDVQIATGMFSQQEKEAIALINSLSKTHSNINVSGYSLGGYLATAATMKCTSIAKCITFDPPGRYDIIFQNYLNSGAIAKIKTYVVNGSSVSWVGNQAGEVISVNVAPNDIELGPIDIHNHNIEPIFDVLNNGDVVENTWK